MKTIREIMDIIGPDDDDGEWQQSKQRQSKIENIIRFAFKRCDIELSSDEDHAIFYDEEDNRKATVKLDDMEISLSKLSKLLQSGLSNDFIVSSNNHELTIEFYVSSELDNSV
jgi:hypothetical protein